MQKIIFRYITAYIFISTIFLFPKTVTAEENVLRLLVWPGYAPKEYRKSFEDMICKKYNRKVTLEVTYLEGTAEFYSHLRKKDFDLVSLTHHLFKDERFKLTTNGILLPLNITNIPRYKNLLPKLQSLDNLRQGDVIFGVALSKGLYALTYNKDVFKDAPSSWNIIWDKKHKGAYTLGEKEHLFNICTAALALGYNKEQLTDFKTLNNPEFKKKLKEMVQNAGGFWISEDKPSDLIGKSFCLGWGDPVSSVKNWAFAMPKEGSMCWIDAYAITWSLKDKPFLKKVAEEWINHLLGPQYQIEYNIRLSSVPPVTTDTEPFQSKEDKALMASKELKYLTNNYIPLPTCSQRDRNGLTLLWENALKGIKIKENISK